MKIKSKRGIISRYWWVPLIAGLISVGLGIWCLCDPMTSLPVLAYVFAGCVTAAGAVYCAMAFSATSTYSGWGWMLAVGLLELLCGIWLLCIPQPALTIAFMYVIGIWILVVAINGICEACAMSAISPAWIIWAVLLLLCTIGFGIVFITNPVLSTVTEWMWLGLALITYGLYRISFGYRLNQIGKRTDGLI